jgi:3-oxoadipate CoA-transferase alpha subunit
VIDKTGQDAAAAVAGISDGATVMIGDSGLAALLAEGRVRRIICSFPRQADSWVFDRLYRAGDIELEIVPQGNLAERIRAAGARIGAFFSSTGVGTALAIGHPLGGSGGRVVGRAAHELARRGSGVAVVAICIGVGQALAIVLER